MRLTKFLVEPHEPDKFLLFLETEDEFTVHNAQDTMVIGMGMKGRVETRFARERM
jgi:hypothetical protein